MLSEIGKSINIYIWFIIENKCYENQHLISTIDNRQ